jgi:DNA-binding NarL/FixJ family response regulator
MPRRAISRALKMDFLCLINPPTVSNEKLVVLIVDESVLIIERMIGMLEELENIQIILQAGSYAEAMEIIQELEPDVVLLDIYLPDKTGMELLKVIREKYQTIEVAVITNYASENYRNICKKLGAHHFFDKSKDFDMIPKMIFDKSPQ